MAKKELTDFDYALKHKYRVESGGDFVPGVTTAIGIIDKPALVWSAAEIAARCATENSRRKKSIVKKHREWLASSRGKSATTKRKHELAQFGSDDDVFVHWARGEHDRVWRAKAERGTRVHDVAERWARGEEVDVLDEDNGFVDALESFHFQYRPRFIMAERIVLNRQLGYGGRFDAIAELSGNGIEGRFMLDWKTGGQYPMNVAMQFAGYLEGDLATFDEAGNLRAAHEWEVLPELDGALTVYLREDGTVRVSQAFERIDHAAAFRAFRSALELHKATTEISRVLETENEND